jgi:hypothetical protein
MKRFALKTKLGEVISYVSATNINEAIELFSIRKQLKLSELTKIFNVDMVD